MKAEVSNNKKISPETDERWFVNKNPFVFAPNQASFSYKNIFTVPELEKFQTIEDFEIKMLGDREDRMGRYLRFYSNAFGNLTSFPWWDHVDEMIKDWEISDIPLGTISEPFDDGEQGWRVFIFCENDYVYILEGDEIGCREFKIWYRVSKENYIKEWKKILENVDDIVNKY